ncbi:COG1559 Aminodeoxychorismate lyase [Acidimicrobiia bacterium]
MGGRRWGRVIGVVAIAVVLVFGAISFWVNGQLNPGSPGDEVAFTIAAGSTVSQVSSRLAEKKIIANASVFDWYLKFKGESSFQAGDYEGLRTNSSAGDVVTILKAGPAPPRTVEFLVREGLWESEIRALILEAFPKMSPEALDAALASTHPSLQPAGSTNLEGFLFPAKYEVANANDADPQSLIDQMIEAFDRVSSAEGLPDATAKLAGVAGQRKITPYEALIVASLVESEAKLPEDRPKIARVIYNRIAKGMSLGIDASVLYALQQRKASLTSKDLAFDSPYNTRLKSGIPPAPINSPGKASINAALNPAPGDWIYYVLTDKDGSHYFTNSASDFQRAVNDAKARGVF